MAVTILIPVVLLGTVGCTASSPTSGRQETSASKPIEWESCEQLNNQLVQAEDLLGMANPFTGYMDRLECGTVEVPLDYSQPNGRQIEIAVSRMIPVDGAEQVVFTNPGGPGLEGRTMPAYLAMSGMSELTDQRIVVGIDSRGTGASTSLSCESLLMLEPPEAGAENKETALAYAETISQANTECVDEDRELISSMTDANAARDLEQIRTAMGVDTVDFFGASWGTELGAVYLSMFPNSVNNAVLDSMTDLRFQAKDSLSDIAETVKDNESADLGDSEILPEDGASNPDGENNEAEAMGEESQSDDQASEPSTNLEADLPLYMPLSAEARVAYTCNTYTGASDIEQQWQGYQDRIKSIGPTAKERTAHPLESEIAGVSVCSGWPIEVQSPDIKKVDSNLLIFGHETESVTPVGWSEYAQSVLGGKLTILDDGTTPRYQTVTLLNKQLNTYWESLETLFSKSFSDKVGG